MSFPLQFPSLSPVQIIEEVLFANSRYVSLLIQVYTICYWTVRSITPFTKTIYFSYDLAAEFHTAIIERMARIGMDLTEFVLARVILCLSIGKFH